MGLAREKTCSESSWVRKNFLLAVGGFSLGERHEYALKTDRGDIRQETNAGKMPALRVGLGTRGGRVRWVARLRCHRQRRALLVALGED